MKICVLVPPLQKRGGVASYYSALRAYLPSNIRYFVRGARDNERSSALRLVRDYLRFAREIANRETALVHVNTSLTGGSVWRDAIFIIIARCLRKRVLVFFRGWSPEFQARVRGGWLLLMRQTFFRADALVVLAAEFEETLREWGYKGSIYRETTTVADDLVRRVMSSPMRVGQGEVKVLFLARIEEDKGIFELLEAHRNLRKRGLDVRLIVAGDGGAFDELNDLVGDQEIPAVELRGFVKGEGKRRAFSEADIYAFPTRHGEGMANSVLEAMAFGLPVVTTPVGGVKDFFIEGKMGFLTPDPCPETYAGILENLIQHPELRRKIGEFNRAYARQHFLASAVAERLSEIYRKVLGEGYERLPLSVSEEFPAPAKGAR